jgi:plasmid stabilization system protein ParE
MPGYKIKIFPLALSDIQDATNWYNKQSSGLGKHFQKQVLKQISKLNLNANIYAIRYNNIRCMVIKKFPFMVHYLIENDQVLIFAVLHTSRNPKIWEKLRDQDF